MNSLSKQSPISSPSENYPSRIPCSPFLHTLKKGEVLNDTFQILEKIAEGGMGAVYLAFDKKLQRKVAVKTMNTAQTCPNYQGFLRFQSEARICAQLNHPNIIKIYEVGLHRDIPYFVMEYIRGKKITQYIQIKKRFDWHLHVTLIKKIAQGLAHMHSHNVLHRDVKPSNILVRQNGEPVLIDFGIAKDLENDIVQTQTENISGTIRYMSLEQMRGKKDQVDARTDIYSLGIVLYELLTQRPAYQGTLGNIISQMLYHNLTSPHQYNSHIPKQISDITMKAIQVDKDKRYASMNEFIEDLESFLKNTPPLQKSTKKITLSEFYSTIMQQRNLLSPKKYVFPTRKIVASILFVVCTLCAFLVHLQIQNKQSINVLTESTIPSIETNATFSSDTEEWNIPFDDYIIFSQQSTLPEYNPNGLHLFEKIKNKKEKITYSEQNEIYDENNKEQENYNVPSPSIWTPTQKPTQKIQKQSIPFHELKINSTPSYIKTDSTPSYTEQNKQQTSSTHFTKSITPVLPQEISSSSPKTFTIISKTKKSSTPVEKKSLEDNKQLDNNSNEEMENNSNEEMENNSNEEMENNSNEEPNNIDMDTILAKIVSTNEFIQQVLPNSHYSPSLYHFLHLQTSLQFVLIIPNEGTLAPFLVSHFECTRKIWQQVMETTPWTFQNGNIDHSIDNKMIPATGMTFQDCQEFCEKTKLAIPTVQQWEYIASLHEINRIYQTTPEQLFYYCWSRENALYHDIPSPIFVPEKQSNLLGVFDTLGNVQEWCVTSDGKSIYKGGSFLQTLDKCIESQYNQSIVNPNIRAIDLGFRPVFLIPMD
ncbi:MAG: protein kinase [Planctomycetes bacterium]|nr:protein kinase [Planctomycetota bacterium]